ncbi:Oxysterol-binding protein [Xylaria cf. heliscus]|nr:Oxysterol-binding protein [Xylaria cf. heliscus]
MTALQSNFSQLRDFLYYLATIKGDLSHITAPPFVLSPTSVTEIPTAWACRHALFQQPAHESDAATRALLVLKNFLCSLKPQLQSVATAAGTPKKPLNAFLGELFIGSFAGSSSSSSSDCHTRVVAEQVSHHPPVTACAAYNADAGLSSAGYVAPETSFSLASGGVRVRQVGHAVVRDERHGEFHLRTLPTMVVRGLLAGACYAELEGVCYVASSSGFLSTVRFAGAKAWWGGERNCVRAELVRLPRDGENENGEGKMLYEITGQWSGRLTVTECATGAVLEEFDVDDVPRSEIRTLPIEEQSPWESRRAWRGVVEGIRKGDMGRVHAEKKKIEEAQRRMRKAEELVGAEWPAVFFRRVSESPEFERLARAIPDPGARELACDKTAGVWEFVGPDAAEALISEGVYHRDLEPTSPIFSN